jgi:hypothetical protein
VKDADALNGAVAQLGERRPCKAEVVGSNPISSTTLRVKLVGLVGIESQSSLLYTERRSNGVYGRLECSPGLPNVNQARIPEIQRFLDN